MLKAALIACIILGLTGCGAGPIPPREEPDRQVMAERFDACMKNLPAGPVATKYNDWDEVVDSCNRAAYFQSLRKVN